MEIFPITEVYCSDEDGEGEMVDTGLIVGYEAVDADGTVLGQGETVAEATEAAYIAMYLPKSAR